MSQQHSEEFKRDAVHIALTSGLTRRQVASDLDVVLSTLGKWIQKFRMDERPAAPDQTLQTEIVRLRKENSVLRQERGILK